MIKFSSDEVQFLHRMLIEATGGSDGVRDSGLLDSALASAYATFDGKELFPTKEEKAARLGAGLIANHAFVDGNKRIGVLVLLCFAELNGIRLEASDEEVIGIGLAIARGDMKYGQLLEWIENHEAN